MRFWIFKMKTQQRLTFAVDSYGKHLIWTQIFSLLGSKEVPKQVTEVLWITGIFPTCFPPML